MADRRQSAPGTLTFDPKINVGDIIAMVVAMVAALAVFFGLEGQVKQNAQAIRYNSERIANQAEDVQRGISALDDRLIRMENKVDDLRQVLLDGLNDMRLRELRNDQGDSSR